MSAVSVLVIDDQRSFRFAAIYARSSAQALALLEANRYAEIWLDHDLGGRDTIWPVIERLEALAVAGTPLAVERLVIHSANPVGAQRMLAALARHYPVLRVSAADYLG